MAFNLLAFIDSIVLPGPAPEAPKPEPDYEAILASVEPRPRPVTSLWVDRAVDNDIPIPVFGGPLSIR